MNLDLSPGPGQSPGGVWGETFGVYSKTFVKNVRRNVQKLFQTYSIVEANTK